MKKYEYTNTLKVKIQKKSDHDEENRTDIYTSNSYSKKCHLHVLFRTMVFSFDLRDVWLEITQSSFTAGLGENKKTIDYPLCICQKHLLKLGDLPNLIGKLLTSHTFKIT